MCLLNSYKFIRQITSSPGDAGTSLVEMIIGNEIPIPIGNPMGIPWEWELMTQLGMEMGRNGYHPVWEWEWPLFPWE